MDGSSQQHPVMGVPQKTTTCMARTGFASCQRACFQCGKVGHQTATCQEPQLTEAGKAAFQNYLKLIEERRKKFGSKRKPKKAGHKKKSNSPLHRFEKLRQWMAELSLPDLEEEEAETVAPARTACGAGAAAAAAASNTIRTTRTTPQEKHSTFPVDPVTLVNEPTFHSHKDSKRSKTRENYFTIAKHLHHSYREFFGAFLERTRQRFNETDEFKSSSGYYGSTDSISSSSNSNPNMQQTYQHQRKQKYDSLWQGPLTEAVKHGNPADFSQDKGIWIYADNKLIPRSRYLFYLLMDNNRLSNRMRQLFLPVRRHDKHGVEAFNKNDSSDAGGVVNVCSIGGGPGYDHLSLSVACGFLWEIQPNHQEDFVSRYVRTQIFDLYDQAWAPVMTTLQNCFRNSEGTKESRESSQIPMVQKGNGNKTTANNALWRNGEMTMHHGDLRLELDHGSDDDSDGRSEGNTSDDSISTTSMALSICTADIIVFQFVLHENASSLIDAQGNLVGAPASILRMARKGSFCICTDSSHTLWPTIKRFALDGGSGSGCWEALSDADNNADHSIILGPKSYLLLEKVA